MTLRAASGDVRELESLAGDPWLKFGDLWLDFFFKTRYFLVVGCLFLVGSCWFLVVCLVVYF